MSDDMASGAAKPRHEPKTAAGDPRREAVALGRTLSGRPVPLVAPPRRDEAKWFLEALGFPGEAPFTRGVRATMYRSRLWTMHEYAGFGTAEQANRRFKYLLSEGNEDPASDLPGSGRGC